MIKKIVVNELCRFIIQARENSSYACQGERAPSKCIMSKNYLYIDGEYRYEDQYFGEFYDVGEEIVWYQGVPVWGMGYRGGIYNEFNNIRIETFTFLREALLHLDVKFPVRGPQKYVRDDYVYVNNYEGSITSFVGKEVILKNGIEIYERNYLGGLILGKENIDAEVIEKVE